MKTPAMLMELRRARYEGLLKTMEWRSFAHRMKAAAGFACQICKRGGLELNVHHHAYEYDRHPWQYEQWEVAVLCKGCHQGMHEQLQSFRKNVFRYLTPQSFRVLNGALTVALDRHRTDSLELGHAIANLVSTPGAVRRFAGAWT